MKPTDHRKLSHIEDIRPSEEEIIGMTRNPAWMAFIQDVCGGLNDAYKDIAAPGRTDQERCQLAGRIQVLETICAFTENLMDSAKTDAPTESRVQVMGEFKRAIEQLRGQNDATQVK